MLLLVRRARGKIVALCLYCYMCMLDFGMNLVKEKTTEVKGLHETHNGITVT